MHERLYRSIDTPIREGLSWNETWRGPDDGLIFCWERGRQERVERPEDAARANQDELIGLDWKGGVTKKLQAKLMPGTLRYLATWQGIRGEDLDLDLEGERILVCSRTGQAVAFSSSFPEHKEEFLATSTE